MVFALQGFTKEFIAMEEDGIGVEYLGIRPFREKCSVAVLFYRKAATIRI